MADKVDPALPDLAKGIPAAKVPDGECVRGRVGEDEVLLVRSGNALFAVGSHCTHYHGPLADGLIVGDTIRCPWHHACFSLKTGEALRAPALDSIACFQVRRDGDNVFVGDKIEEPRPSVPSARDKAAAPASIIIVGGGAAGLAAADMLRREGYDGSVTIISADGDGPVDRPNLSKDFLAGQAQADWIPLRPPEFYTERKIELLLETRASSLDPAGRTIRLSDGSQRSFGALLIATGADPVRLPIPGAETVKVHYLRSFADSRAIVEKATAGSRAVVAGSSFIGLEVAASLRARGVTVHVVGPEQVPLERVMGREVGQFVQSLHEEKGVAFHLGQTIARLSPGSATLSNGESLEADFVVIGAGVRPTTDLAERAGLRMDRGILVNEYLETSAPGIFAAGDVARWPDPYSGQPIRVEHWVVAERQGQAAARNMLGRRERFDAVPFFWSQHYDVTINYVGHAEKWDAVRIDGTLESRDCAVTYTREGRVLAVATIFRDKQSLQAEVDMERNITSTVKK